MAKRHFLMLAHTADLVKDSIGGWFMSEKLDGMRCFWDGGMTRGMRCAAIPFANTEKHDRFTVERLATGLWSRYGQPISAPDWFLDGLPKCFLDGELYAGRGNFQLVVSAVKKHVPVDSEWQRIEYVVFDAPCWRQWMRPDHINETNFYKMITKDTLNWVVSLAALKGTMAGVDAAFQSTYDFLCDVHTKQWSQIWRTHFQKRLPFAQDKAVAEVEEMLNKVTDLKGEGLMLRKPESYWEPVRSHHLLKVKHFEDSEATVVGYVTGRQTDKGSKLLGMMGAMIVDWQGKRFELSGFTDAERVLGCTKEAHFTDEHNMKGVGDSKARVWAEQNPETELPDWAEAMCFPRGSIVTFRYRELTDDGIPKEARFWRAGP